MTVPAFLEARLAELGGDVDALARALLAEGWHLKNVERVLGVEILADGGSRTSSPEGANASGARAELRPPAAHAPAPRRGGSTATAPPSLTVAAPPRERQRGERKARLLGPVRAPDAGRAAYGERVDLEDYFASNDAVATPPPPKSNVRFLPVEERPRMFPGRGVRHDCVHESECLGRALSTQRDLTSVHCPTGCKFLTPPSREQRIAEATAGKALGYHA